jgi:16S rRNA (cytidine1402-2'-O)-methyltransferase
LVMAKGVLYVVATPIGHLGDVTQRALDTLKSVDGVVCEDTRHTQKALGVWGLSKRTMSLPAFAEGERAGPLVDQLIDGANLALVTDAGTPGISDPGEKLVAEAVAAGVQVVPIPGPSAVIAALSASGLPAGRFHFAGFLPRQQSEANDMLDELRGLSSTLVFYEAPGRVAATLARLHEVLGDRPACLARELTKHFETFDRASLSALAARYATEEVRGEVVLLVGGRQRESRWSEVEVQQALSAGLARGERLKSLSQDVAKRAGWVSADVYKLGVLLK